MIPCVPIRRILKDLSFLRMQKYLCSLTTALRHHRVFIMKDISGLPLCSKTLQTADLPNYQNNLRVATWFVPRGAENSVKPEPAWFSVRLPRLSETLQAGVGPKQRRSSAAPARLGERQPPTRGPQRKTPNCSCHIKSEHSSRHPNPNPGAQFHTRTEKAYFTIPV